MKSTVETLSPTRVRLAVEVPFDELKPSLDKAYANIAKQVRDSKLKVQAQIQGEQLRVVSKSKDELQQAIAFLKGKDFEIDLQFTNYR